MRLGNFRTSTGRELTEVHLESLGVWWFQADVCLENIPENAGSARLGAVKNLKRAAISELQFKAHRVCAVFSGQLKHVQAELIRLGVEVPEIVVLRSRMI